MAETSGQQASACLLGHPSFITSHQLTYCFVPAAIQYAIVRFQHIFKQNDNDEKEHNVFESKELSVEDINVFGDDDENFESVFNVPLKKVTNPGKNKFTSVLIPDHLAYSYRGKELENLSLYEWNGIIVIKPKPKYVKKYSNSEKPHFKW